MITRVIECPSCGAAITPKGSAATTLCLHCHTSVVVPEELRFTSEASNWPVLVFDPFTTNENGWLVGDPPSDEFFHYCRKTIKDGRYRWEAKINRSSSLVSAWLRGFRIADFHLIVNCKHICGSKTGSGCGVVFRVQDNRNYYGIRMTDRQFFSVSVVKEGHWKTLIDWSRSNAIKPNGVNQIEVLAHGTHFGFLINGQTVGEVDDNQFAEGLVGLVLDGFHSGEETTFDFLDFTLRAP